VFSATHVRDDPDGGRPWSDETRAMATADLFEELVPPLLPAEAVVEADRCLECGGVYAPAPCTVACPAGIDVPAFVAAIARDDPDAAAATIFSENLLGGTCARVCPVEVLCQSVCVLEHEGRAPIAIGRLQRFATEHAFRTGARLRPPATPTGRRIAVLGAGPAGLASAGELAALGHTVTVYDERPEPGGLVRYAIAPYRQLREPLPDELRALTRLGVRFEFRFKIDGPETLRAIEADADAVVLAIGMGADADVHYPGEHLWGVWDSLPFIELVKLGSPPDVGDRVAVIGGGNTAVDVAREAVRLGAAEVTLLYRRTEAEMPAYPHEVEEARGEGVRIRWLTAPVRFVGNGRLERVECLQMRLGEPDTDGRRRPEPVPGSEFALPCDTAVKAIGQRPRAELLSWIDGLELRSGLIEVDADGRTTNAKYFAAGDATNGGATVVEAVREAKVVARGIDAAMRSAR
jgi:dihydropyrimidine dehydrogenase (NAD+) subunit PreT